MDGRLVLQSDPVSISHEDIAWGALVTSHLVGVREFELPAVSRPADERLAGLVCKELQQKLPQLNRSTTYRHAQKQCKKYTLVLIFKEIYCMCVHLS